MTLNDNRDDDLTQRRWCSHASAERRPDEYDLWDDGARGCGAHLGHLFQEQVSPKVVCDGVPSGRNDLDSEVAGLSEGHGGGRVQEGDQRGAHVETVGHVQEGVPHVFGAWCPPVGDAYNDTKLRVQAVCAFLQVDTTGALGAQVDRCGCFSLPWPSCSVR